MASPKVHKQYPAGLCYKASRCLLGCNIAAIDTKRTTRVIPLDIQLTEHAAIRFLRDEVNAEHYAPLALVRYAIRGIEKSKALRLDLDKRAFIDPQDLEVSEEFVEVSRRVAPVIAERVSREAWRWFSTER